MLYVPGQPIQYIEQNPVQYLCPEARGMDYEEVWLKTKDNIRLQGWFMFQPNDTKNRETLIFFHENAGNIGLRMDWFQLVYTNLGVNVLAVAYRGFSASEGKPTQEGILIDAEAVLEYAKSEDRINNERVFLVGRSLGGAVATHTVAKLAEQKNEWPKGLILENTFTSVSKMADSLFPFLKLIPSLKNRMLRLDWDSSKRIGSIKMPILVVAGSKDALCPLAMSNELYEAAQGSSAKDFFLVENGNHNDTFMVGGPAYWIRLREFMDKCLGEKTNWVEERNQILVKQNPQTGVVEVHPFYTSGETISHGGQPEMQESAQVEEEDAAVTEEPANKKDD